jgi:hypothetical protein
VSKSINGRASQDGLLALCLGIAAITTAPAAPPAPAVPETLAADWIGEGMQAGARLGWSAETAGDVNGDGLADIVGGAYRWSSSAQTAAGAVFLYYGRSSTLSAVPDWLFSCEDGGANCGVAVASAGDVNADGFDDLIVGASYLTASLTSGVPQPGRAYLFYGSSGGPSVLPSWEASPDAGGTLFGSDVSGAGDVNGDGYADFVVTAPDYSNAEVDEGHAMLWYGSAAGPSTAPGWSFEPDIPGEHLTQATVAGDVNGDGYGDLLVGARRPDGASHAWLFYGGATGLAASPAWTAEGQAGAQFGSAVNGAGDVNGDGYGDVVIVADLHDDNGIDEGAAFVWLGGPDGAIGRSVTGTTVNADWSYGGYVSNSLLRWADGVGDFTGDGYDDLVLGHSQYSGGQAGEGRILVFAGSPGGLGAAPVFLSESNRSGAHLGWTVAGAGDVNGDGRPDIVAGAERYSNGELEEGALHLYLGGQPITCIDEDGDGYGSPPSSVCPAGELPDCNDADPAIHPGATEICDCKDNNCDGRGDEGRLACAFLDTDGDHVFCDNCPTIPNSNQQDSDNDGVGDHCDNCPNVPNPGQSDFDEDRIGDVCDSCPYVPSLQDTDGDGFGDVCDNCPQVFNTSQSDLDNDARGDACDNCVFQANSAQGNADGDGFGDVCDNCILVPNPGQDDSDADGRGNSCDNCASIPNPDQRDFDGDGRGDACDPCPTMPNVEVCVPAPPAYDILIDFQAPAGKGSGLITWRTWLETGAIGFNVVILRGGTRTQLNPALIPCQDCGGGSGGSYAVAVAKHRNGQDIFVGPAVRR